MTERDFVYWLQGYLEISGSKELTPEQVQIINDHLKLVLKKVTPSYIITTTPGTSIFPYTSCTGELGCTCSGCKPLTVTC